MKKVFIVSALFLSFLFFPSPTNAHLVGQPPFFKVNEKFADFYPVQSNSYLPDFVIPQDIAPETYLVHTPITFELDRTQLLNIITEETIHVAKFEWDFGDGTTGQTGLKNTHTYTKEGSYIVAISIAYQDSAIPSQLFQSTLLHVLPSKTYQLPKPKIRVNDTDVTGNEIDVDFDDTIIFDASESNATTKIVSYQWDFDDGEMARKATTSHQYTSRVFASPILRIKDANGFIVDTGISLNQKENQFFIKPLGIAIILGATTLIGGMLLFKRRATR